MGKLKGKKRGNSIAYVLGSTLIALVSVATIVLLYWGHSGLETTCKEVPQSVVEIVIDVSDPLPQVTQSEIKQRIVAELSDNESKGALVEVRILRPDNFLGETVFSSCHPGNGSEVSELDGDPERSKANWQNKFLTPFTTVLSSALAEANPANSSPLLETIQAISVEQFIGRSGPKRLILISDMLQHSKLVSFYNGNIRDYDDLRNLPIWPAVKPMLANVGVQYFVLGRRSTKVQTSDLKHFWCISWELAAKDTNPELGENCPGWRDLVGLGN